ncbi:MAG: hypothetical protein J5770_06050 [Bacteroidaceae bacterium]|nr:hypothetical protein [Bacteroidaceae bacterium]
MRRLSLEEFDVNLLRILTLEGRVYVDLPYEVDEDVFKCEILEYVSSINVYVTDAWHEDIDELWETIVNNEHLQNFLVMKRGSHAGHMNRYAVTSLVCRMQNLNVYSKDVPMLTLHLQLEGVKKKNKYYMSCGNYQLDRSDVRIINELCRRV